MPVDTAADLELSAPLARFHGDRPPAPTWFERAVAAEPERSFVEVDGVAIELLVWGERGRQGLLFIHGGGAHADWWSFLAPFFATSFRVAAISISGMGRSGWRERYSLDQFADEAAAGARAAGLFDADPAPVVIAHSFGSRPALVLAARPGSGFGGAIILDAAISAAESHEEPPSPPRPTRIYPSFDAAVGRFRLEPPQRCANAFLLDHIARHSLRPATLESGEEGWTWRFDPFLWRRLQPGVRMQAEAALKTIRVPVALIYGEQSRVVQTANLAYTRSIAPANMPVIAIPEAGHHLFLDQPIAVVAALRAVLAGMGR